MKSIESNATENDYSILTDYFLNSPINIPISMENKMDSIKTTLKDGIQEWRNEQGLLHRENAPARIYCNGYEEWWENGNFKEIRLGKEGKKCE